MITCTMSCNSLTHVFLLIIYNYVNSVRFSYALSVLTLAELGCTADLFANWIRYENRLGSNDNKSTLLARVGPTIGVR